jgi:hypothetical protein
MSYDSSGFSASSGRNNFTLPHDTARFRRDPQARKGSLLISAPESPRREGGVHTISPDPDLSRAADLPQPKVLETKRQYGARVYDHVKDTVSPVLRSVSAKLTQAELTARDAQGFRRAAEESLQAVSSARLDVEVQRRHGQQKLERSETQLRELLQLVLRGGSALEQRRQVMLAACGREVENRSRVPGHNVNHDEPDLDRGPKLGL